MLRFKPIYLTSNVREPLLSEWYSDASLTCSPDEFAEDRLLILPPMSPTPLKIDFKCCANGRPLDAQSLEAMVKAFDKGAPFWQNQLLYGFNCRLDGTTLKLELRCKLWNANKMSTLLQKPKELRPHRNLPTVAFCTELQVQASFHHLPHRLDLHGMVSQFNEYLSSLIISQLEFQLPLVFSIVARNRFKTQESDVGPISYGLTDSSALIPLEVQLIAMDKTATTVCQILRPRRQTNRIKFQILIPPDVTN